MTPEIIYEARVYVNGTPTGKMLAEKLAKARNFSFNRYESYASRFSSALESLNSEMDKVVSSLTEANVPVTRSRILNTLIDSKRDKNFGDLDFPAPNHHDSSKRGFAPA